MLALIKSLRGDKVIWALIALLALFSFMPVFSASSNLAYAGKGTGNTVSYLIKHLVHVALGFFIVYRIHKIPYHYFRSISRILLPFIWLLLAYTLFKGTVIAGANASRWIQVPFVGISFQPSTFAFIVLMIFVARYLSKTREEPLTFKSSFIDLWLPVGITLMFILPANFSTAALIFAMVLMLVFIGKYPLKYIGAVLGIGIVSFAFFILIAKAFPNPLTTRVNTWEARIERFFNDDVQDPDEVYQIERAKTAIATGGIYGLGPGKSVQKNFLPQSSSDFIYAIIVEEFGLAGGLAILGIYLLLFFRIVIAAHKANTLFGKLVVVGLGFPIVFQAMINMGVAVELLPTTGQTLPLISSGGSSIWVTCLALGIIINVTKKEEEIAAENKEKAMRDAALQKMIDKQLKEDEEALIKSDEEKDEDYSIEDNPMNAVLNKS
ncbi:putative lipid II flippase FtsW [Flavobacterium azooxidireducens]|uniref:Probable peptidoglycan glycosyltransferase FtsW n=1 Tax=Flavobacterium azooxidireducens TaxID=1871076 RepID=A0ABY4KGL3_9FLAO|nr:putative peptidoglycan glycosyltransferase FtsW [Flavobacterium azooxidireducens]UPQ79947.1 putative lipid II flippase FtsW [Flavobacterium azooxidireducens]